MTLQITDVDTLRALPAGSVLRHPNGPLIQTEGEGKPLRLRAKSTELALDDLHPSDFPMVLLSGPVQDEAVARLATELAEMTQRAQEYLRGAEEARARVVHLEAELEAAREGRRRAAGYLSVAQEKVIRFEALTKALSRMADDTWLTRRDRVGHGELRRSPEMGIEECASDLRIILASPDPTLWLTTREHPIHMKEAPRG